MSIIDIQIHKICAKNSIKIDYKIFLQIYVLIINYLLT